MNPAVKRRLASVRHDDGAAPEIGNDTVSNNAAIRIRDLQPDRQNRRSHNARNVRMVQDALERVGAARSIVIDETGVVLAGNATLKAAKKAGITHVHVVDADGTTIIAVRRRGLSDEQKRTLALYDNRAAELATWDDGQLRADVNAGLDLSAFFDSAELADLLGADAPTPDFEPAPESSQGHLDQLERPSITCPACGHRFAPTREGSW